ncbi:hypothetical protein ACKP2L_04725 [Oenococcus alcoholitolerans]|uniref:Uncharacterized protein n=1 Tax=Oenococcus alcoholitolerans TaxID=931074 RepID=A0ABR4XNV5_9LACO|nr:hypothetical protein Q757_09230 [Oenococcus alcoholitolerans]
MLDFLKNQGLPESIFSNEIVQLIYDLETRQFSKSNSSNNNKNS